MCMHACMHAFACLYAEVTFGLAMDVDYISRDLSMFGSFEPFTFETVAGRSVSVAFEMISLVTLDTDIVYT